MSDTILTIADAANALRGLSESAAAEFLVGKTIGTISFLRISDRTKQYNSWYTKNDGSPSTITRHFIVRRCNKCGDVHESAVSTIRSSINSGTLGCTLCSRLGEPQNLVGQRFHDLTVIERIGEWRGQKTVWRVRCELCGRESTIDHAHLGITKSCTCTRSKNLAAGQEFNHGLYADGSYVSAVDGKRALNKNSTTKICGVSTVRLSGGKIKYRAYINFRRKQYALGCYDTPEKAAEARKKAETEIYGDFLKWYAETHPNEWAKYNQSNKENTNA